MEGAWTSQNPFAVLGVFRDSMEEEEGKEKQVMLLPDVDPRTAVDGVDGATPHEAEEAAEPAKVDEEGISSYPPKISGLPHGRMSLVGAIAKVSLRCNDRGSCTVTMLVLHPGPERRRQYFERKLSYDATSRDPGSTR